MKVLLVDDEAPLVRSYEKELEKRGFEVDAFTSGQEALDALMSQDDYDFLVTDHMMPGVSGIHIIEEAGKSGKDCYIILITSHHDNVELVNRVLGTHDTEIRVKPFNASQLANRLLALKRSAEAE